MGEDSPRHFDCSPPAKPTSCCQITRMLAVPPSRQEDHEGNARHPRETVAERRVPVLSDERMPSSCVLRLSCTYVVCVRHVLADNSRFRPIFRHVRGLVRASLGRRYEVGARVRPSGVYGCLKMPTRAVVSPPPFFPEKQRVEEYSVFSCRCPSKRSVRSSWVM